MRARPQSLWTFIPWFRPRLQAPPVAGEALRIERVIAAARLLLTLVALVQLNRPLPIPPEYFFQAQVFLLVFAVHGLVAIVWLRTRQRTTKWFTLTTHAIDLVVSVAMLPVAGPPSPFFVFFLFVLAAAAFRWGLRETFATNLVALALVFMHAKLTVWWPILNFGNPYELDRVLIRAAYLSMIGLILGYLAEESRLLRAETAAIAGMLGHVRADLSATRVLTDIAAEVQRLFNAKNLLLAVENRATGRAFRWDSTTGWTVASPAIPGDSGGGVDEHEFLFGSPKQTLALTRKFWRRVSPLAYHITRLDPSSRRRDVHEVLLPQAFVTAYPYRRIISVPVTFSEEWKGRVFVFDPTLNVRLVSLAECLQKMVREVAPAVLSVYLLGELRSRAGAIERSRVARELHDGVIQSLVGIEMRLAALRNQAVLSTTAEEEVRRLQQMVRDEVLNLRDLMTQMRSPELDPNELLDYLAQLVDRFGRDSGITARFSSDLKEVVLSRQVCFELVRIVQEGLVNIRKHSGATSVVVRFGRTEGQWVLEIDDNGHGFPFAGTMSLEQLDEGRKGPIVIKDRVRAIGGQLTLESMPHRGTRLKVLVPQEAAYA